MGYLLRHLTVALLSLVFCARGWVPLTRSSRACVPLRAQLPNGAQSTTYTADAWDRDLFAALGYDDEKTDLQTQSPALTKEEEMLLREARFHVRSFTAKAIYSLVKEIQRMKDSRFGKGEAPLTWKSIRKAAMQTRLDLGKEDIKREEALRLFIRNTLRKKLEDLNVSPEAFFRAADVNSPEWRVCRKRGLEEEEKASLQKDCFVELGSSAEIVARLNGIILPASMGEQLLTAYEECKDVILKLEPLLKRDEERGLLRLTSTHLAETGGEVSKGPSRPRAARSNRSGPKKTYEVPPRQEGRI